MFVLDFKTDNALIFFCNLFHLTAAEAVGGGILLGGQQIAVLISQDFSMERIFTVDCKVQPIHFDADGNIAVPGSGAMRPFQRLPGRYRSYS